jgi:hypothetical protein
MRFSEDYPNLREGYIGGLGNEAHQDPATAELETLRRLAATNSGAAEELARLEGRALPPIIGLADQFSTQQDELLITEPGEAFEQYRIRGDEA